MTAEIDHPKIGALVRVLIALMRIRGEGKRSAVGSPRGGGHVNAEMRQLLRQSAVARDDVQLIRRSRRRIARIRKIAAAVESNIHPVIRAAFEALFELLFGRGEFA